MFVLYQKSQSLVLLDIHSECQMKLTKHVGYTLTRTLATSSSSVITRPIFCSLEKPHCLITRVSDYNL